METVVKEIQKAALITIGTASLIVGIAGVLLPLIPGTPFLIVSAICFSWAAAL